MASVGRGSQALAGALVPLSRAIAAAGGRDDGVDPQRHHKLDTLQKIRDLAAHLRGSPLLDRPSRALLLSFVDTAMGTGQAPRRGSYLPATVLPSLVLSPQDLSAGLCHPLRSAFIDCVASSAVGHTLAQGLVTTLMVGPPSPGFCSATKGATAAALLDSGESGGDYAQEGDNSNEDDEKQAEGESEGYSHEGDKSKEAEEKQQSEGKELTNLQRLEFDLSNKAYSLHQQKVNQNKVQILQEVEAARLKELDEQLQKKGVAQDQRLEFDLSKKAYSLHQQKVNQNKVQILQEVEAARLKELAKQLQKKGVAQDQEGKELELERQKLQSRTADIQRREAHVAKEMEQVSADKLQFSQERKVMEAEKHDLVVKRRLLEGLLKMSVLDKQSSETSLQTFKARVLGLNTVGKEWIALAVLLSGLALCVYAVNPLAVFHYVVGEFEEQWDPIKKKIHKAQQKVEPIQDILDRGKQQYDLSARHEFDF